MLVLHNSNLLYYVTAPYYHEEKIMANQSIMESRTAISLMLKEALNQSDVRSKEERVAHGASLRGDVPLSVHATWTVPENRPDPVELLREQNQTRVQKLVPLRHERMSASAFTFYRGAALIMASDLSHTPTSGIEVQACGDAHISNFGLFSSPERRTVFDINDFDETSRGPWEWDVKRLATSVEICGRDIELSKKERKRAVLASVRGYREGMAKFASMGHLDMWYAHSDIDELAQHLSGKLSKRQQKVAKKVLAKAKNKNSARAVQKLTEVVDGQLRIISDPPLIVPFRDLAQTAGAGDLVSRVDMEQLVRLVLANYCKTLPDSIRHVVEQYRGVDIAHKVVGVGSVGTRALIVVMEGADKGDPLVLQIKEAQESVLERFCGKSPFEQHGERVVKGQQALQTSGDLLLGWCRLPGQDGTFKDYYVRQLWNGKGSFDLAAFDATRLEKLATACGWALAHAHARTGDRFTIAGYLGDDDAFDRAILKFARAYAKQNETDYQRFLQALESGELPTNAS